VVRCQPGDPTPPEDAGGRLEGRPFVLIVVAQGDQAQSWSGVADVIVSPDDPALEDVVANVTQRPLACTALALLLRKSEERSVAGGLVAESAVYSTLQAGPEFASWREGRPVKDPAGQDQNRVRVERRASHLEVTLDRPEKRNALDRQMRDELVDAFRVALVDPAVEQIVWRGEGPAFCTGGDLDEFGTRPDPASAHVIRLQRSLPGMLEHVGPRLTTYVHGQCMGSGVELAAFSQSVVATPDTTFSLPEVMLGLIPGAGGTVSLPRRMGRLHTAWLGLSGRTIDAATARDWGLVDRVE
jgi:hypothetical protein